MKADYYSDPSLWQRPPEDIKFATNALVAFKHTPDFYLRQLMFLLSDLDLLQDYWANRDHQRFAALEADIVELMSKLYSRIKFWPMPEDKREVLNLFYTFVFYKHEILKAKYLLHKETMLAGQLEQTTTVLRAYNEMIASYNSSIQQQACYTFPMAFPEVFVDASSRNMSHIIVAQRDQAVRARASVEKAYIALKSEAIAATAPLELTVATALYTPERCSFGFKILSGYLKSFAEAIKAQDASKAEVCQKECLIKLKSLRKQTTCLLAKSQEQYQDLSVRYNQQLEQFEKLRGQFEHMKIGAVGDYFAKPRAVRPGTVQ